MKGKKWLSALLVSAMLTGVLAGCGNSDAPSSEQGSSQQESSKEESSAEAESSEEDGQEEGSEASDQDPLSIEIYDVAANYQGVQSGWFAKVVKDRFNIELNIIAPQVAGDAIFKTRVKAGNLGDILILEKENLPDCVAVGLVKDISGEIGNYSNLMTYKEQIDVFNNGLPDNDAGITWGIPAQMTNTSPTTYSQEEIYSSPQLRWDLYKELGYPDIADLDGLLDVLEQMMEAHPTNEAGDPAYPFSLWADWDGGDEMLGIANVAQLTTWYGEKIKGSAILKPDNTFIKLTDKTGTYYKLLKFLNDAQRRGLVDPDSGTQDWNAACAKMSAGQVYLMWHSQQTDLWNSQDRLEAGSAFSFVPVKDQTYYTDSDTYYGSTCVFAVGSMVDDEKYAKIMEFLDWYASPEGLTFQHCGIEGFNYTVGEDGKYTSINDNALADNLPVPEEWGTEGYQDGSNAINQWIVEAISKNPDTGEPYDGRYWASYKEAAMTEMKKEWQEKFDAEDSVDYMTKNNILLVSPDISVTLESDSDDISAIRKQCNDTICDYSWKMIFAKNDKEFSSMWKEMNKQLVELGFTDLYNFDVEKYQVEVDAKIAATK